MGLSSNGDYIVAGTQEDSGGAVQLLHKTFFEPKIIISKTPSLYEDLVNLSWAFDKSYDRNITNFEWYIDGTEYNDPFLILEDLDIGSYNVSLRVKFSEFSIFNFLPNSYYLI